MAPRAALLGAFAIAALMGVSPTDTATIVNSGSTNTYGYSIEVWSNGKASATLREKGGATAGSPKAFTLPAPTVARFFADLAAVRKGNAPSVACMKSASFGTTVHVTWQGWVSPDLSCPQSDSLGAALAKDVDDIRQRAGFTNLPLRSGGAVNESSPP